MPQVQQPEGRFFGMCELFHSCVHTHTVFCDGADTPQAMAEAALALQFVSLGFSGHGAAAYDSAAMTPEKEQAYQESVLALRQQYQGRLEILLGVEHDSLAPYSAFPYDYLIESVHYFAHEGELLCVDLSREETVSHIARFADPYAYCKAYFAQCAAAYEKSPAQIAGHLDLVAKFNEGGALFDEDDPRYRAAALEAMDAAVSRGMAVEVNTGAIARGYRTVPYPAPPLLKALREMGGQVILTSDCHDSRNLTCHYRESAELLRSCGFTEALVLRRDGFHAVGL